MSRGALQYFPRYGDMRSTLRVLDGRRVSEFSEFLEAIHDVSVAAMVPIDWSNPDTWIIERLPGEHIELARAVWEGSGRNVRPRHMLNLFGYARNCDLLIPEGNAFRLTRRGANFMREEPKALADLDAMAGLPSLLTIMDAHDRASLEDLLQEWAAFVRCDSPFPDDAWIRRSLCQRLGNLEERGYVACDETGYVVTPIGAEHVPRMPRITRDLRRSAEDAVRAFNERQRRELRNRLAVMLPYDFEKLIRDLLAKMGYSDVIVTPQSGDKGIDVVATVQFGITTITEVVQVKRQQRNIGRPTLDQLRGALPYHKALRGTIITLGAFSRGCADASIFPGAAPITLIDGNKLLDLLIEHEIGIKKRPAVMYELDETVFEFSDPQIDEAMSSGDQ